MKRIIISGTAGGGGKTLLSLGLCRALKNRGLQVQPFKKGPDYIDAAWLAKAAHRPCTNLDPFFLDEARLRALFAHRMIGAAPADIAVIEGNRGLYDGRDVAGSCSTAALSRTLDAPILLTLNVTKMTRTAAAVAVGLARFEPIRLAGVVLNQVGTGRHENLLRQAMEAAGIPVLGALPRLAENPIPERHMGLVGLHELPGASQNAVTDTAEACLEQLGAFVAGHVDMESIVRIAGETGFAAQPPFWTDSPAVPASRPRIGYVQDAALWFYYNENLEALERAGAELVRVSLFAAQPWPQLDGLYLGGGFPELFAEDLSRSPRLEDLRSLAARHAPIYAECGGFMLLCRSVRVGGVDYPLSGVLDAATVFERRPQGLGYVEATVEGENPFHPVGTVFRGHEFHYSRCETTAPMLLSLGDGTGMGRGRDGLLSGNTFAAYTHLFAPCVPHWAPSFVRAASAVRL